MRCVRLLLQWHLLRATRVSNNLPYLALEAGATVLRLRVVVVPSEAHVMRLLTDALVLL